MLSAPRALLARLSWPVAGRPLAAGRPPPAARRPPPGPAACLCLPLPASASRARPSARRTAGWLLPPRRAWPAAACVAWPAPARRPPRPPYAHRLAPVETFPQSGPSCAECRAGRQCESLAPRRPPPPPPWLLGRSRSPPSPSRATELALWPWRRIAAQRAHVIRHRRAAHGPCDILLLLPLLAVSAASPRPRPPLLLPLLLRRSSSSRPSLFALAAALLVLVFVIGPVFSAASTEPKAALSVDMPLLWSPTLSRGAPSGFNPSRWT